MGAGRSPGPEDFRALARSSPWRWRTVRFTLQWAGGPHHTVRGWVRRPDALRVETFTGELLQAGVEGRQGSRSVLVTPVTGPAARRDGLRAAPRQPADRYEHDAPMYQNYYWVALLDPWELADGEHGPGTAIDDLAVVDHHGRPAWQAVVRPTQGYEPRCGCCELLPNPATHAREWGSEGHGHPAGYTYGEAFRVRLDVATGICVRLEQLGGTDAGRGHEMNLEAGDENLPDELFAAPPRPWHERLARRVQGRPPRAARGYAPYRSGPED